MPTAATERAITNPLYADGSGNSNSNRSGKLDVMILENKLQARTRGGIAGLVFVGLLAIIALVRAP